MNNFFKRFLVTILLGPLILYLVWIGGIYFNCLIVVLFFFGLYEILLLKKLLIKFSIFLIFLFFIYALFHLSLDNNGREYLYLCILITWLSDSGGYIFGKIIKGKKIKIISPNKTYSGFFGALILPQIISLFFLNNHLIVDLNLKNLPIKILILSSMSILGDLFFSYIKRVLVIKDYSNLIPGHGGVFDRIDSLIFVVLTFFIIY
jgi:phosphatidate cytidylyltransferase